MSSNDEKFFAWLDGELSGADAAEMEARVAADPEVARLAEQHRALGNRLRGAFNPIAEAPLPERLRAALRSPAEVIGLAAAKRPPAKSTLPQWAAMAASLAIGLFVGTMIPQANGAPVEVQGGNLYAAAGLDQALDTRLASAPGGDVRIGMTFRDPSGAICRTFTQARASGLACRDNERWQLRGLFAAPEGGAGDYRMAAGMDPNLAALVDTAMAGEPFDAAAEKAARARGWR